MNDKQDVVAEMAVRIADAEARVYELEKHIIRLCAKLDALDQTESFVVKEARRILAVNDPENTK